MAKSSIDTITMIEKEIFFPLAPVYLTSCDVITGNANYNLKKRNARQDLMTKRNNEFKRVKKEK